jgi:hypothetical protein
VNTLYYLEEWRGKQRISPPEDNFTSRGQNSPLGDNFAPGVKVLPLGPKLRMGLCSCLIKEWVQTLPREMMVASNDRRPVVDEAVLSRQVAEASRMRMRTGSSKEALLLQHGQLCLQPAATRKEER